MEKKGRKYVYVLDFEDGRVYRYDVWIDSANDLESGIYFYTLSNGEEIVTKRMIVASK